MMDLCPETTVQQNVLSDMVPLSPAVDPLTDQPIVGGPIIPLAARRGRKSSLKIVLSTAVLSILLALQRKTTAPAGLVRRTRAVLLLADGHSSVSVAEKVGLWPRHVSKWGHRFSQHGVDGLLDKTRPGRKPKFAPSVALHLVKMACEMPDLRGRSLSQWDCQEMARQLEAEGVVDSISNQSVWRILNNHRLKPWRHHLWLSPKVPRDAAFASTVRNLSDLYSRPLAPGEVVLCVDEKTSLQPRTRKAKTLPPEPGKPIRVESEYERKGALNLFAAFDTRTGKVYHCTGERKRQIDFLPLLEIIDREFDSSVTDIHIVLDNARMHKGKLVQAWLANHTRFHFHHPPVHCSWMNQVEQWFSILQRKRFGIANFAGKQELAERLDAFVSEWNSHAHPFRWSRKSFDKVLAKCEANMSAAA
jgi:transposase